MCLCPHGRASTAAQRKVCELYCMLFESMCLSACVVSSCSLLNAVCVCVLCHALCELCALLYAVFFLCALLYAVHVCASL